MWKFLKESALKENKDRINRYVTVLKVHIRSADGHIAGGVCSKSPIKFLPAIKWKESKKSILFFLWFLKILKDGAYEMMRKWGQNIKQYLDNRSRQRYS